MNSKKPTKTGGTRSSLHLPESIMVKFVVASQGSQGTQSQRICEYNLCTSIYPYLQLKMNIVNIGVATFVKFLYWIFLQDTIQISLHSGNRKFLPFRFTGTWYHSLLWKFLLSAIANHSGATGLIFLSNVVFSVVANYNSGAHDYHFSVEGCIVRDCQPFGSTWLHLSVEGCVVHFVGKGIAKNPVRYLAFHFRGISCCLVFFKYFFLTLHMFQVILNNQRINLHVFQVILTNQRVNLPVFQVILTNQGVNNILILIQLHPMWLLWSIIQT